MKNNLLPIAKEGWNYIAYAVAVLLCSLLLDFETLSLLSFAFIVFLGYLFRNPERELLRSEEKSVLSPVDGTVTSIEEIEDSSYLYKVTIESKYSDISVLRVPMSAKVEEFTTFNGARLCSTSPLSKLINEHATLVFTDKFENTIKLTHCLDQSFCAIKIDPIKNRNMLQSTRYGTMVKGISEVYLPKNFRVNISIKDEVKASSTLLGYFS